MVTRVCAAVFACMLTLTLASGVAAAQDDVQPPPAPPEPVPMRDEPPSESPREAQLNALAKARNFNDSQKRDVGAIWKMLDDAAGGKRTVNELPLSWVGQDAVKEGALVFVPFIVMLDTARTAGGDVWLSWRAIPKSAPSGGQPRPRNQPVIEDISIVPPRQAPGGRIARAFVAPPGEYDLYIVVRDVTPSRRGAPSPKASVLKQSVTVPNFGTELTTSSVFVPATISRLPAPLAPRDRIERPYAIGTIEVVPVASRTFDKDGNLSAFFQIYNQRSGTDRKPNVTVDYTFYTKQQGGEQLFNKTAPQILDATTLPPEFDPARHLLQTSMMVPLTSFPPGDYRLEIAITDLVAAKTITREVLFTVTGG